MSKVILIPDIHLKVDRAQRILDKESPDFTIYLNDFPDDFNDTPEMNRKAAIWMKSKLINDNCVWLHSNHTSHYLSANRNARCSGYSEHKDYAINDVLTNHDWLQLKWFYWLDDILITHAGLSNVFVDGLSIKEIKEKLDREQEEATKQLYKLGGKHWFFNCGVVRYGSSPFGGLVWNDFDQEFIPVPGLKQVFGHSIVPEPTWNGDNLCLDTNLQHYAIYEAGTLTVHPVLPSIL